MKKRTRKLALGMMLFAGVGIGVFSYLLKKAPIAMQTVGTKSQNTSGGTAVSAALAAGRATATPAAAAAKNVSYGLTDGTYTGRREYAFYGYVKVQAIVQNGKLQKVRVLEHPNDNGTSRYINSIAMPYLVQEAVQAQSTNISLISGATLSSEAFLKSLSSALSQAGA